MKIYLVYECYFKDDGKFVKMLRKIYDSAFKADEYINNYNDTLLQWAEIEERNLE